LVTRLRDASLADFDFHRIALLALDVEGGEVGRDFDPEEIFAGRCGDLEADDLVRISLTVEFLVHRALDDILVVTQGNAVLDVLHVDRGPGNRVRLSIEEHLTPEEGDDDENGDPDEDARIDS
jgi:hypothetical protein